jgi:hypothetical protein
MVLHTWGQRLTEHVHVHCVVTGGGLTPDRQHGRSVVRAGRQPFLFPVTALSQLSQLFRGKFLAGLQRLRHRGQLGYVGASAPLAAPHHWQDLLAALRQSHWVVYAKPPFGGPQQVLKYLSRYTHRVAIANQRLVFVGNGLVRFRYIDYAAHRAPKEMTLPAEEFLRRCLLHVVPPGFIRIRHYGILANRTRAENLARCRALLTPRATPPAAAAAAGDCRDDPDRRPVCGGQLRLIERLAPSPHDTS